MNDSAEMDRETTIWVRNQGPEMPNCLFEIMGFNILTEPPVVRAAITVGSVVTTIAFSVCVVF